MEERDPGKHDARPFVHELYGELSCLETPI
jgi:hypothetical protein